MAPAMEVSLLSQSAIPQDTYISIRAGSARRQAAINCGKAFRFPKLGVEESPVKIDILQSIGTAYVVVRPGEERYQAVFHGSGPEGMACELEVRPAQGEAYDDKEAMLKEKPVTTEETQKYLETTRILPFVQAVMQTVIKERPPDPYKHVARHLMCGYHPADNRGTQRLGISSQGWQATATMPLNEQTLQRVASTSEEPPVAAAAQLAGLPASAAAASPSRAAPQEQKQSISTPDVFKAFAAVTKPPLDVTIRRVATPPLEPIASPVVESAAPPALPEQEKAVPKEHLAHKAAPVRSAPSPLASPASAAVAAVSDTALRDPHPAAVKVQINSITQEMPPSGPWGGGPSQDEAASGVTAASAFTRVTGVSSDEANEYAAHTMLEKAVFLPFPAMSNSPSQPSPPLSDVAASVYSRVSGLSSDEEANLSAAQGLLDQAMLNPLALSVGAASLEAPRAAPEEEAANQASDVDDAAAPEQTPAAKLFQDETTPAAAATAGAPPEPRAEDVAAAAVAAELFEIAQEAAEAEVAEVEVPAFAADPTQESCVAEEEPEAPAPEVEEDNSWEALIARGEVKPSLSWHDAAVSGELKTMEWLLLNKESLIELRDDEKSTALHCAAKAGHLNVCEWLLKKEADPNAQDRGRATPLHVACLGGHLEVCQLFLDPERLWADAEDGCPISRWPDAASTDLWRCTPLHRAAEGGNAKVVSLLLDKDKKASLSKEDREGDTPLHKAIMAGHAEALSAMLGKPRLNPPIDSTNGAGMSPLDLCVLHKQAAAGDLLLKAGARLVKDVRKKPPTLLEGVQKGLPFLCSYVLKMAADVGPSSRSKQLSAVDEEGRTPMQLAARAGSGELLQRLLDGKADPSTAAPNGKLPIHEAAEAGQVGALQCLFKSGVAPTSVDGAGRTALFSAAAAGRAELCAWLLEQDCGLDVDARDNSECSALHAAAEGGSNAVCELLLQRAEACGCFEELLQAEDWEGSTAVHAAVKSGSAEVCRSLSLRGADVHAPLEYGVTTLQVAAECGHNEVLQFLISDLQAKGGLQDAFAARRVSDNRNAWLVAAASGHQGCCEQLWAAAGDAAGETLGSCVDRDGRNALMLAASGGHVALCQWLLQSTSGAGAGLTAVDNVGGTVLHVASAEGQKDVVKFLLASEADPAALDDEGNTPKDWALARSQHIVESLLKDAERAAAA